MSLRRQKRVLAWTFLLPALVVYVLFVVWPYAKAFRMSLYDWSGLSDNMTFVGLDNFARLLVEDPNFWGAVSHTLQFLVVVGVFIPVFALFLAVLLTKKLIGSKLFSVIYFFPRLISVVAIGILWSVVYNPIFGLLNGALGAVGLDGLTRGWLGDPNTALWATMVPMAWMWIGFFVLIFTAGLGNIPPSLYEAATVDGAGEWQRFRFVTVPLLWETLRLALVFVVIRVLGIFDLIQVMTGGGPNGHTEVMATYYYQLAFQNYEFGYASAMAVMLFVLIFGVSWLSMRLTRRDNVEY